MHCFLVMMSVWGLPETTPVLYFKGCVIAVPAPTKCWNTIKKDSIGVNDDPEEHFRYTRLVRQAFHT